jgi:putative membrane protein
MMEEKQDNIKPTISTPSDHLANERTFLAWIRTGIALMGFGFVVVKFALFIRQISLVLHKPGMPEPSPAYSSQIGTMLIAVGIIMVFYAYIRYRITEKQLFQHEYRPSYLLALLVTILILISGVALIFFLLPNL